MTIVKVYLYASELSSAIKMLLLLPLLTHLLIPHDYGIWAQTSVFIATAMAVIVMGTDNAVYSITRLLSINDVNRLMASWFVYIIGIFIIFVLISSIYYIDIIKIYYGVANDGSKLFLCIIYYIASSLCVLYIKNYFRSVDRLILYSKIIIFYNFIYILNIIIAYFFKQDIYGLLIQISTLDFLFTIIFYKFQIKKLHAFKFKKEYLYELVLFGYKIMPVSIGMCILNYLDRFFLVKYSNLEEIATYSISYSIGYFSSLLIINPLWMQYTSDLKLINSNIESKDSELYYIFLRRSFFISIPFLILIYKFSSSFTELILEKSYNLNVDIVVIIMFSYIMHMLSTGIEFRFNLRKLQIIPNIVIIISCFINLLLCFHLIPNQSIFGAALSTALTFIIQFLILYFLSLIFIKKNTYKSCAN